MKSIHQRLVLSLFVVWASVWLAVAWISLDRSQHEVGELMDAQLAQTAHVLRQITLSGHLSDLSATPQTFSPIGHPYESMLSFQFWRDGVLIGSFGAAPPQPLASTSGFSDHRIGDTHWRVFGLPTERAGEIIYVAQHYAIREELIEYLTLHALRPILWSLPLTALLIWIAVADGLRPLRRIAREIGKRSADQLAPLDVQRAPIEIRPLANALNALMQRLARALEAERHFAADASHALKTPFSIIRTHAQIAQRSSDAEERDKALRRLVLGIDRASHLISQLLTLSRLHHGADDTEPTPECALSPLVHQALEQQHDAAANSSIALSCRLPPDDPCMVTAPASALAILIDTLLENAIKYSPRGGRIHLGLTLGRNQARLRIRDHGPGIDAKDRDRVFDRFYRAADQGQPGAGLGLSIARRICELYDIGIELLEPEDGPGLLVELIFPMA